MRSVNQNTNIAAFYAVLSLVLSLTCSKYFQTVYYYLLLSLLVVVVLLLLVVVVVVLLLFYINNRFLYYFILAIDFTFIDTTIVGYVTNISPVKTRKGNIKRKYFTFDMDICGNKERTVCFYPEKHPLINKIEETDIACELKRFKRSDTNDTFITDYTSVN